jgi:hypothetical protein
LSLGDINNVLGRDEDGEHNNDIKIFYHGAGGF